MSGEPQQAHQQHSSAAPKHQHPYRIAIVGGGLSAATLLIQLAKLAAARSTLAPIHVTVIDPAEQLGRGIAYAVNSPDLLLNVRSDRLTADAAIPGDFHNWINANHHQHHQHNNNNNPPAPDYFSRWSFGDYARQRLAESLAAAGPNLTLQHIRSAATSLKLVHNHHSDESTPTITTRNTDGTPGPTIAADHAVLALGLGPTRTPRPLLPLTQPNAHHLLVSPWDQQAMQRLAATPGPILIVGTGLTMCDAVITLKKHNTKAQLVAISRRGLVPRVHDHTDPTQHADWAATLPGQSLASITTKLRSRATPDNWRSVIDSLRPHTAPIWAALNTTERARFIRHLATYWDVHRHRMPPQVADALEQLKQQNQLHIIRARLESASPDPSAPTQANIKLQPCSTSNSDNKYYNIPRTYTGVVLCTGPDSNPANWNTPLTSELLKQNLATTDPLGLGFRTTQQGLLINTNNQTIPQLSTLGPLRRSDLWESIAAPEIVAQAKTLANTIAAARPTHPPQR